MKRLFAVLVMFSLLAAGCAAPSAAVTTGDDQDAPVVTVFKAPT